MHHCFCLHLDDQLTGDQQATDTVVVHCESGFAFACECDSNCWNNYLIQLPVAKQTMAQL